MTTPESTVEAVEVTQADSDRAAEYLAALFPEMPLLAERVKENGAGLARFFAAHRIASLPAATEHEEAARISRASVMELFEAIAHGDREHREWLQEALRNWADGKPVPEPRSADAPSPTDQAKLIAELEQLATEHMEKCPSPLSGGGTNYDVGYANGLRRAAAIIASARNGSNRNG